MTDQKRPLFIVGTDHEAAAVRSAGHEAVSVHGMDAAGLANLALDIVGSNRAAAIVMADDGTAASVADACAAAGAPVKALSHWQVGEIGTAEYAETLDREEADALARADERRAEANRMQLLDMGVHDTFDVLTELAAGTADREPVPTGLSNVDDLLGGGLPTGGLTIIGALSSAGKTTICNQIADNVAAEGGQVLFVSCEQSRFEVVAMSVSRMVRQIPTRNGGHYIAPRAAIQSARARAGWGGPLWTAFNTACTEYSTRISPRMHVMEPNGQPTTADIRRAAEAIRRQTGAAPFVVVDYLQLLAPENEHMDERRAVGANTLALRQMARDLDTCVLLISALNRASYGEGVTMSAFRESSAIEYSSDLLLALEPQGMSRRLLDTKGDRQRQEAREIVAEFRDSAVKDVELRVLKNRAGAVPRDGATLTFEAASSFFYPSATQADTAETGRTRRLK